MAESMMREALKQGMKIWIVTNERVRTKVAELREDLEDVVIEAQQEYDGQVDADPETVAAAAPRRKVTRAPAKREQRARPTGVAKATKVERTAKAV